MRITEDIIRALRNCIDAVGSISEFSQQSNVKIETISNYLGRKTKSIQKETWHKIYPLLHPYLLKNNHNNHVAPKPKPTTAAKHCKGHEVNLSSDEKILLDAFAALPAAVKNQKLLEIVELARLEVSRGKRSV